jgi:flavin reductase (DIM6/NTAB) family NADH-FMN oxidoreductase RutF
MEIYIVDYYVYPCVWKGVYKMITKDNFSEISPYDFSSPIFNDIAKKWMLIGTPDGKNGRVNAMTASWGGVGIIWNKPYAVCFIRPQRYSFDLAEKCDKIALSFLTETENSREIYNVCGTKSGRDTDKIKETGLSPIDFDGAVGFAEAETVIVGKKIYADMIKPECFLDESIIEKSYPGKDFHKIYLCEIEKIYVRK